MLTGRAARRVARSKRVMRSRCPTKTMSPDCRGSNGQFQSSPEEGTGGSDGGSDGGSNHAI